MAWITVRKAARRDLIDHYVYLAENASESIAERFLNQAEASFTMLSQHPEIGAPLTLRHPDLQGLRKWSVQDFENILIFYRPSEEGIAIIRMLHAARDWWDLLGIV
jgi:toxin ParE1/3/4